MRQENAEKAIVNKEAHVVEEISINKDVDEEDETIRETVRETEVDIEDDLSTDDKRKRDLNLGKSNDDRDINV